MTTAVYCRVSSKIQEEANGTDAQERSVREWLVRNGIKEAAWYREASAVSGTSTKGRAAYLRLLADVRDGHITKIVAYSLSRLSRSVADAAEIINLCADKGVSMVCVSDGFTFDPTSPFSKAMAQIASVFAELNAAIIRENVRTGVRAAIARGQKWGMAHHQKVTDEKLLEVRAWDKDGVSLSQMALRLGVCKDTARSARNRSRALRAKTTQGASVPSEAPSGPLDAGNAVHAPDAG